MGDRAVVVGMSVALAATIAACGGATTFTDASIGDAAPPDAPGCAKHWTVSKRPEGSASVTGGALVLAATNFAMGAAVTVKQGGVTGDFDLRFDLASFASGGSGSFVQARLYQDVVSPAPRFLSAGMGNIPAVGISAADQPSGLTDIQATTATSGSFRFQRTGATVIVTSTAGATTATVTATSFDFTPLAIEIQLGSNNGTVAGTAGAQLSAFTAVGSGVGDAFDCDSLN